ncbi:MAG: NfeD family protein [Dehalococcoidales bacterium]
MDVWLIVLIVTISVFLIVFVVERVAAAHKNRISAGREELVGRTAIVKRTLNPQGTVFLEGEIWNAEIDCGSAETGEYVIIKQTDGLKLFVSKNLNDGGDN